MSEAIAKKPRGQRRSDPNAKLAGYLWPTPKKPPELTGGFHPRNKTALAPRSSITTAARRKAERADPPHEVEIEDALMKRLVSGAEARRYVEPATETYSFSRMHCQSAA